MSISRGLEYIIDTSGVMDSVLKGLLGLSSYFTSKPAINVIVEQQHFSTAETAYPNYESW